MKSKSEISAEEWEALEGFLHDELPPEQREAFEARLAADEVLRKKLAEMRLLETGIKEAVVQAKMDEFHSHVMPSTQTMPTAKRSSIQIWLAAASIILVIIIGTVLIVNRKTKEEKLFARYYEPDSGLATAMSAAEDYTFNRAMIDYKTGHYSSAITAWNQLLLTKPGNDTLHYFTGVAHLAAKQYDSAVYHFRKVLALPENSFRSDASWYLALALIRQNKQPEAMQYLQQSSHARKEELLSQLK